MGLLPDGKYIVKTSRDTVGKVTQSVYPYNPKLLAKEGLYREVSIEEAELVEAGKVIPQAMPLDQLEGKTTMFIPDEYANEVLALLNRLEDQETITLPATESMPNVTIKNGADSAVVDFSKAKREDLGPESPDEEREESFDMVKIRKMASKNAVEAFVMETFAQDLPRDMELSEMKTHAVNLLKERAKAEKAEAKAS